MENPKEKSSTENGDDIDVDIDIDALISQLGPPPTPLPKRTMNTDLDLTCLAHIFDLHNFLDANDIYQDIDLSKYRLPIKEVVDLIRTQAQRSLPVYPNLDPTPDTPEWAYEFASCPNLNPPRSVPIMRPLDIIKDALVFLFRVAKPGEDDETLLNIIHAEACGPGGWEKIEASLSKGHMTVVSGCESKYGSLDFDPDNPFFKMVCPLDTTMEAQNCFGLFSNVSRAPRYQKMPLGDFLRLAKDPISVYNILSCGNFGLGDSPIWVSALADERHARLASEVYDVKHDLIHYGGWMLLAHTFAFSNIHHDSSGFATWIIGVHGKKYWFYFVWTITPGRKEWERHRECMEASDVFSIEYAEDPPWVVRRSKGEFESIDWEVYESMHSKFETTRRVGRWRVIEVVKGKAIVQPPGMSHVVYTAENSILSGGHFLPMASMHHTRVSCYNDAQNGKFTTNDSHPAFRFILYNLALTLGEFKPDGTLDKVHKRGYSDVQLHSLARLILTGHYYQPQMTPKERGTFASLGSQHTDLEEKAKLVMKRLVSDQKWVVPGFGPPPVARMISHNPLVKTIEDTQFMSFPERYGNSWKDTALA